MVIVIIYIIKPFADQSEKVFDKKKKKKRFVLNTEEFLQLRDQPFSNRINTKGVN